MIAILTDKEKSNVTREGLMEMEREIIALFGFDFNFSCHNIFVDRYLRMLNQHKEEVLLMMSNELCKFSLNEVTLLKYKPSIIAACSVILSINIFKREECTFDNTNK